MLFRRVSVVIDISPLNQRVLRFCLLESRMVLDCDIDEERQTTRHKFRRVRWWCRLDKRNNTMDRREVPQAAIDEALEKMRSQITYE